jgi:hypothetical protein
MVKASHEYRVPTKRGNAMHSHEDDLKLFAQATRQESQDAFNEGNMIDAAELNKLANELEEEVKRLAMERVKQYGRAA